MPHPSCHLTHVPGPSRDGRSGHMAAVWICEYPYRTMRMQGPSSDCAGCPVWHQMEQAKMDAAEAATPEAPCPMHAAAIH